MIMMGNNQIVLFVYVGLLLLVQIAADPDRKKVNCRKYVFAPICRGVAAKRDLQKLEPLFESPRIPRHSRCFNNIDEEIAQSKQQEINRNILESEIGTNSNKQWSDRDIYDNKGLLDILTKKLRGKNMDYENGSVDGPFTNK